MATRKLRIQLWSYNYDPEPQGIAPLSAMLARALCDLGHEVLVVAAHPHYPEPAWGVRIRPYRERRDGVPILRLPLWPGRRDAVERIRQELTFLAAQALVSPLLPTPDVLVAVTPSFPALAPAAGFAAVRRIPWVMWVQDIVTDGASTTGELSAGPLLASARAFERWTYASADKVVVISEAFRSNLEAKGVEPEKMARIFNPSSRASTKPNDVYALASKPPRILAMGNIGHSQGLDRIVDAFEGNGDLSRMGARLIIAGSGVAVDDVRARIQTARVEMTGVLYGPELEPELRSATFGLVSQRGDVDEFNLPSKLMNYMAYGIPVLASVRPGSETARIVESSGAGWVTDAARPEQFAEAAARMVRDPAAMLSASRAGFEFANRRLTPSAIARQFEELLVGVVERTG